MPFCKMWAPSVNSHQPLAKLPSPSIDIPVQGLLRLAPDKLWTTEPVVCSQGPTVDVLIHGVEEPYALEWNPYVGGWNVYLI